MKILYSWLKEYINITKSPKQLAQDLTMFAHEVESVTSIDNHDAILDIEITPNRGDCMSYLGIARQVAAMYHIDCIETRFNPREFALDKKIDLEIENNELSQRYSARIIDNIKITDSPKWLKDRLLVHGIRAINNVVDVTNYVMLATGQPMHAFDYDKIENGKLNILLSRKSDEITTLDDKKRTLPQGAIIIKDSKKIFDLCGIMGGNNSEIDEGTKTIILQSAVFSPQLIRRAAKMVNIQTEASYRYERGVDVGGTLNALNMASELIYETSPKSLVGPIIDIKNNYKPRVITFSDNQINRLLGTTLSHQEITNALESLYFEISGDKAKVPSFRDYDVQIWQDLAEEIAKVYGYNNIKRNMPSKSISKTNLKWKSRELLKDKIAKLGFSEIYSYSFADKEKIDLLGYDLSQCVEIINPISPETQYLRPSLMPSLLAAIAKNPWSPEINIFELEKVFDKNSEKWQLGVATLSKSDEVLKKIINFVKTPKKIMDVEKNTLDAYKIRRPVKVLIIDLDEYIMDNESINYTISKNKYRQVSKYPPTIRDIAFIVRSNLDAQKVKKSILEASEAILLVELFDEYSSAKIGEQNKNIAFHIWLQDINSTMATEEVDKIIKFIIKIIENKYHAKLRS